MASSVGASSAAAAPEEAPTTYVRPMPPYNEETDIAAGIDCFYPMCNYKKCTSYGKMYKHVTGYHDHNAETLRGTYLYDKGREDISATSKSYYHRTKETQAVKRKARKELWCHARG